METVKYDRVYATVGFLIEAVPYIRIVEGTYLYHAVHLFSLQHRSNFLKVIFIISEFIKNKSTKCLTLLSWLTFSLKGRSSGEISCIIGNTMAQVGAYCSKKRKCLAMEDLDTTKSKNGLQYGSPLRNRKVTTFAYKKMTESAMSQGYKNRFAVYKTDPAYTSQIGKIRFMRQLGCSVHDAAAYAIGLKAMGLENLLTLPEYLTELLPKDVSNDIWKQWAKITQSLKGARTHALYQTVTPADWSGRKQRTLKNYRAILESKDSQQPIKSLAI